MKSGVDVPSWMLSLKAASSKRWKELEKRPVKRKTISTDRERNVNKRFWKLMEKDAKRLRKQALAAASEAQVVEEGGDE